MATAAFCSTLQSMRCDWQGMRKPIAVRVRIVRLREQTSPVDAFQVWGLAVQAKACHKALNACTKLPMPHS